MIGSSHTTGIVRLARGLAVGVVAVMLLGGIAQAAAQTSADSAQLWIVNTRCAPTCAPSDPDDSRITYSVMGEDGEWLTSDQAGFVAEARVDVPNIVFLHGNWVDAQDAVNDGWQIYSQLKQEAEGRPFRFVIWSWPSERLDRRVLDDVRLKAAWSDVQSYYLASLVHHIAADVPVTLLGYSFGSRAVTGTLQMLAGGEVAGMALPPPVGPPRPRLRAVCLAAALDSDWLLPGRRNGDALGQVEQLLLTRNLADPILKRYHWLYGRCPVEALGWAGPACPGGLGAEEAKLEIVDVTCWVGRHHDFRLYAHAAPASCRLAWYCFLVDSAPQPAATGVAGADPPAGEN